MALLFSHKYKNKGITMADEQASNNVSTNNEIKTITQKDFNNLFVDISRNILSRTDFDGAGGEFGGLTDERIKKIVTESLKAHPDKPGYVASDILFEVRHPYGSLYGANVEDLSRALGYTPTEVVTFLAQADNDDGKYYVDTVNKTIAPGGGGVDPNYWDKYAFWKNQVQNKEIKIVDEPPPSPPPPTQPPISNNTTINDNNSNQASNNVSTTATIAAIQNQNSSSTATSNTPLAFTTSQTLNAVWGQDFSIDVSSIGGQPPYNFTFDRNDRSPGGFEGLVNLNLTYNPGSNNATFYGKVGSTSLAVPNAALPTTIIITDANGNTTSKTFNVNFTEYTLPPEEQRFINNGGSRIYDINTSVGFYFIRKGGSFTHVPSDWGTYTLAQKAQWIKDNGITNLEIFSSGFPRNTITELENAYNEEALVRYSSAPTIDQKEDVYYSEILDDVFDYSLSEPSFFITEPPSTSDEDNTSTALSDAQRRDDEINAEREAEGFLPTAAGASIAVTASPNTDQFVGDSKNSNQSASVKFEKAIDWRVRISLAPSAPYFYNIAEQTDILWPLKSTNGVIFPYTPQVSLSYSANYDATEPTHSNYKIFSYRGSSVSDISINADFTAQNIAEAAYLRAVIHFFRSASKMFYGQDQSPKAGIPPPLLYLSGFGEYQFDNHPMVLAQFQYTLPADVDYIMAGDITQTIVQGNQQVNAPASSSNPILSQVNRLQANRLAKGGLNTPPIFKNVVTGETTRIPTKMSMSLTFHPIVTRRMVSNKFSLKDYATGKLLNGSKNAGYGGGVW